MSDEQQLGKKPTNTSSTDSDLMWLLKQIKGTASTGKKLIPKKKENMTSEEKVVHNEEVLQVLRNRLEADKKLDKQGEEYKTLVDELTKLEAKNKALKEPNDNKKMSIWEKIIKKKN